MNRPAFTAGRALYALVFCVFGINHLLAGNNMAGYVPEMFPGGGVWIYVTGIAMLLAGVSILLRKLDLYAAWGIILMLTIFVLSIHIPGIASGDPVRKSMGMVNMLKDIALIGGAFMIVSDSYLRERRKVERPLVPRGTP